MLTSNRRYLRFSIRRITMAAVGGTACVPLARERHPINFFLRGLSMRDHLFGDFAQ